MELRRHLEEMDKEGVLLSVDQEVDWNLEACCIGAMGQRVLKGEYVILFNNIKGYGPGNGRLLSCQYLHNRRRPWQYISLHLGLPRDESYSEVKRELFRRMETYIKPTEISAADAPCKEVIKIGKEANLLELPIPFVHSTDGGRYLTSHGFVNQDPDTGWTNVGVYRFMVKGPRRGGMLITPTAQGAGILYNKWEARGDTMPFCIVIGSDSTELFTYASRIPSGVCEYDCIGGLRQEALEVTRAETNSLLVPAYAEVIIEGEVRPGERQDEGPFGEFSGFSHGRNISPIFRITAITHRKNPIIPFTVEGCKDSTTGSLRPWATGYQLGKVAQRAGFQSQLKDTFLTHEAPHMYSYAVDPESPAELSRIIHTVIGSNENFDTYRSIWVDPDVPTWDSRDLFEEVGLNFDPRTAKQYQTDADCLMVAVVFFTDTESRAKGRGAIKRAYNCVTKFRDPQFRPHKDTFERAYPEEVRVKVKEMWSKLGFDEPFEERDY